MNARAQEFLFRLEQLNLDTNDYLVADLYVLTEPLKTDSSAPELFETIFRYFEAHPEADFGTPGPLVHLIEQHRGSYESLLGDSVIRAPMYITVWMVNRILNSDLATFERQKWLNLLTTIEENTSAPEEVREQAARFLEFQRAKF